ncbi:MAG: hypothetical protein US74_C0016G0003 [Parcubacteria group bacterium GW2011_GWA2_38_13]|nr:MAG: hypothetical protein US74_C0016G0003 [Parcubacteria group bacterium GW2011_GWA2_38_13]
MMKEVKSIDEQIRPAHKYLYAALISLAISVILAGVGGGTRNMFIFALGGIPVIVGTISIVICMKIWDKAH